MILAINIMTLICWICTVSFTGYSFYKMNQSYLNKEYDKELEYSTKIDIGCALMWILVFIRCLIYYLGI